MAFQRSPAGIVSLIQFIGIVYAIVADQIMFNETLQSEEIIGSVVIFVVTLFMAVYKLKNPRVVEPICY